eukprot:RCo037436
MPQACLRLPLPTIPPLHRLRSLRALRLRVDFVDETAARSIGHLCMLPALTDLELHVAGFPCPPEDCSVVGDLLQGCQGPCLSRLCLDIRAEISDAMATAICASLSSAQRLTAVALRSWTFHPGPSTDALPELLLLTRRPRALRALGD